jgi:hypothetical protein
MTAIPYLRATSVSLAALLLASCGASGDDLAEPAPGSISIACASGSQAFQQMCFAEQADTSEGLVLTLRKPDGGFQRLRVMQDGTGVVAADGAEPVEVTLKSAQEIEVAVGGMRYRLPAHLGQEKGA